jgi:hypothetical protein
MASTVWHRDTSRFVGSPIRGSPYRGSPRRRGGDSPVRMVPRGRRARSRSLSPRSRTRVELYDDFEDDFEDTVLALSPRSAAARRRRRGLSPTRRGPPPSRRVDRYSPDVVRRRRGGYDYDDYDYDYEEPMSSLLAGEAFRIPQLTPAIHLSGLWSAWDHRTRSGSALDVAMLQFDFDGKFIEGGIVDSLHTRTEWEGARGRWNTTAEYLDDGIEGQRDIMVNLDTVAPNAQSLFFVMSAPVGSIQPEHEPTISITTADAETLASFTPSELHYDARSSGSSTSMVMGRLWRPESVSSVRTSASRQQWVFEAIGIPAFGRVSPSSAASSTSRSQAARYGPISDAIESWLWGETDMMRRRAGGLSVRGAAHRIPGSPRSMYREVHDRRLARRGYRGYEGEDLVYDDPYDHDLSPRTYRTSLTYQSPRSSRYPYTSYSETPACVAC